MGTDEDLLESVHELTSEVHGLSGRLSAKELLAHRTRNLTRIALGLAAVVGIVALVSVIALVRVNKALNCMGEWQAASSVRQKVLNDAAENVAKRTGERDTALGVLVDARGEPNSGTTDQAKADYRTADQAKIGAELRLQILRDEYPPPQIEDFCTGIEVDQKDPKAQGE